MTAAATPRRSRQSAPKAARAGSSERRRSVPAPRARRAGWSEVDVRAVDTARLLAADAVQHKGDGHPGTAMSLAPVAYLLYQQVMRHDPADPRRARIAAHSLPRANGIAAGVVWIVLLVLFVPIATVCAAVGWYMLTR